MLSQSDISVTELSVPRSQFEEVADTVTSSRTSGVNPEERELTEESESVLRPHFEEETGTVDPSATSVKKLEEILDGDILVSSTNEDDDKFTSPTKRKREFEKFLDSKTGQSTETPDKMKFKQNGDTFISPGDTHYKKSKIIGRGCYAKVFHLEGSGGKSKRVIALRERFKHDLDPHLEAKQATKVSQTLYGFGAFFCPDGHDLEKCKSSKKPHHLLMPYFDGQHPNSLLENYIMFIKDRSNADSLVIFALLKVFIALIKANVELLEKSLVHCDAHVGNFLIVYVPENQQLEAKAIDFDKTVVTTGLDEEAINSIIRTDIFNMGMIFDELFYQLKEIEVGRRNVYKLLTVKFKDELSKLSSLIQKMIDEEGEGCRHFKPIQTELENLYTGAQSKFEKINESDFTCEQVCSAPKYEEIAEIEGSSGSLSLSAIFQQ